MWSSSGSAFLLGGLLSLLSSHLLLLLSDHRGVLLLLGEEGPGLMSLLLQVLHVGNEADRVDNTLVIEKHTGDLAGSITVVLLDNLIDVVTNLLATLTSVELLNALDVSHIHQLLLLLLLLGHHLLLGHKLGLIRGHLLHLLLSSSGSLRLLLRRN